MPKTIIWITLGVILLSGLIMLTSACTPTATAEPKYAGPVAEGILQAFTDGDYTKFSKHFTEEMKNAMPQAVFEQTRAQIRVKIGDYVSKEFWRVEKQDIYTSVFYKAEFTKEPEFVTAKVVFQEVHGEMLVSGLWFDSPELRK